LGFTREPPDSGRKSQPMWELNLKKVIDSMKCAGIPWDFDDFGREHAKNFPEQEGTYSPYQC